MDGLKMKKLKKSGFTLIEILLVIGVIMLMTFIKIRDINEETENLQSKMLAGQIQTVAEATNAFLVLKYSELSALSVSGCDSSNQTCSITLQELNDEALLPPNFSTTTILGQPYHIQLKRTGNAPNYMMSGLVLTKGTKATDATPSLVFMGKVLREIGRDGGLNKNKGNIIGTSGGWSADSTLFPILSDKVNYVGSAVGTLSGAYYVYLRRDGTLPMTGDLNMDGHNIKNINNLTATGAITTNGNISGKDINATGAIKSGGNITAGGQIIVHNGYGDEIRIGGDAVGNDYEIRLQSAKPLSIYSPTVPENSRQTTTVFQTNGQFYSLGNIKSDYDITASGNIKGATLEATGRATVGEFIQLNGQATVGSACSPNGLQGRKSEGTLLSCVNGVWSFPNLSTIKLSYNINFGLSDVRYCPDGYNLIFSQGNTNTGGTTCNTAFGIEGNRSYSILGATCGHDVNAKFYIHSLICAKLS